MHLVGIHHCQTHANASISPEREGERKRDASPADQCCVATLRSLPGSVCSPGIQVVLDMDSPALNATLPALNNSSVIGCPKLLEGFWAFFSILVLFKLFIRCYLTFGKRRVGS